MSWSLPWQDVLKMRFVKNLPPALKLREEGFF